MKTSIKVTNLASTARKIPQQKKCGFKERALPAAPDRHDGFDKFFEKRGMAKSGAGWRKKFFQKTKE